MSTVLGRVATGLPALLGVLLGVAAFYVGSRGFLTLLIIGGLAALSKTTAASLVGRRPMAAALLIEGWILLAIALAGLSTMLILWLSLYVPAALSGDETEVKAVSGAIVGAVTTYFATLWTKEIQETGGPFSPGAAYKAILQRAFAKHDRVPDRRSAAYQAIYDERMANGPNGWNRSARRQRAEIIAKHLSEALPTAKSGGESGASK